MAAHDITDKIRLDGKRAVVALDFRHARVYALDAPTHSKPESVAASDPWHLNHNLYHREKNPNGTYDIDAIDTQEFFRTLALELKPAIEVLLLGHGKGKANASHTFEAYVEKHYSDIAARIVATIRCDIDDITDNQLLRLGQMYFGENEPERDYPDSRWGEPRPGE